jgi:hypothetical protein
MIMNGRNVGPIRFIVPEQFKGYIITQTYLDVKSEIERVCYTARLWDKVEDMPVPYYMEHHSEKGSYLVSKPELDKLIDGYEQSLITDPEPIDKDRYWEMLEVLPPCRWANGFFHVSERYTGDLVSWFLEVGEEYWEFRNLATISKADLAKIKKDCIDGKYSTKRAASAD